MKDVNRAMFGDALERIAYIKIGGFLLFVIGSVISLAYFLLCFARSAPIIFNDNTADVNPIIFVYIAFAGLLICGLGFAFRYLHDAYSLR